MYTVVVVHGSYTPEYHCHTSDIQTAHKLGFTIETHAEHESTHSVQVTSFIISRRY